MAGWRVFSGHTSGELIHAARYVSGWRSSSRIASSPPAECPIRMGFNPV